MGGHMCDCSIYAQAPRKATRHPSMQDKHDIPAFKFVTQRLLWVEFFKITITPGSCQQQQYAWVLPLQICVQQCLAPHAP
eukprot:1160821-Pelagomonas_calceolata.AAC.8